MKYYTSEILLKVKVEHYGTPENAINLCKRLLDVPAITEVDTIQCKSNYVLHGEPSEEMKDLTKRLTSGIIKG